MPGKRKKDRKSGKANKVAQKFGANDQTKRNAPNTKTYSAGAKKNQAQSKPFTLKNEAAKSTFRSSKRLWQGEGQKLRNSPVDFVRAVEKYDPGQFLRDQIAANALRQENLVQQDNLEVHAGLGLNSMTTDVAQATSPNAAAVETAASDSMLLDGQDAPQVALQRSAENTILQSHEQDGSSPETMEASTEEGDVAMAVDGLRLESPEVIERPVATSNVDMILDNLLPEQEEEAQQEEDIVDKAKQDEDEGDFDDDDTDGHSHNQSEDDVVENQDIAEVAIAHQDMPEESFFVIDTEGDVHHRPTSSGETILLQPRLPPRSKAAAEPASTPWARTIDDPVYAAETPSRAATSTFQGGHAFESQSSSKRGRRGGKKKQEKINATHGIRRQDEIDVMFDYMENAMWTDVEDEEVDDDDDEDDDDEEEEAAESMIMRLMSQPDGLALEEQDFDMPELGNDEDEDEDAVDADSSTDDSEDDTDIDDDLELMIEAEMEEMEFDLGYSGGRSSKGRRYGADRELVDHALYHEDFNVYQYNSDDDEAEEAAEELGASGARQRGLNKFVNSLDLSDEELEASLIAQWKKDRGSKKEKKRERQRLHQQGLIGKKAKRARASHQVDTRSYGDLDAYHTHIKRFCSHVDYIGIEQLPMPAMDKAVRRAVHVLSQAYGLKSASQGSGKRRHIILYKTKHSAQPPEAEFLEDTLVRARKSLGFNTKFRDVLLPDSARQKLGRSGRPMKNGTRDGGGGRLRDGDLVGADAPEIHVANKGRQMLEKLGWLHGSGLGALGKEGINLPLFATIKNTKHGLQ